MKTLIQKVEQRAKNSKDNFNNHKADFDGRFFDLALAQFISYGWEIAEASIKRSGEEAGFIQSVETLAYTMSNGGQRFSSSGDRDFVAKSVRRAYKIVLDEMFTVWSGVHGERHPLHKIYDKAGLLR